MNTIKRLELMRRDELIHADLAMNSISGNPWPHQRNADVLTEAIESLKCDKLALVEAENKTLRDKAAAFDAAHDHLLKLLVGGKFEEHDRGMSLALRTMETLLKRQEKSLMKKVTEQ
jgi:hypothetical protein